MESENLSLLTETQWRALDKISDVLTETANLQQAFKTGLELLIASLGRPGAALYTARFCEHITQDWTCVNTPAEWEPILFGSRHNAPDHPLSDLVELISSTGEVYPGSKGLNVAAGFPLQITQTFNGVDRKNRTMGVLLVSGPPVPPEAYALWQSFLRPFERVVAIHSHTSNNNNGIPSYSELMRSRNTLRTMFDSLPLSIYIIDPAYNLVAINSSRAARVGEKPNQLVGRKCYVKLYHRSEPCQGCLVQSTFETSQNSSRMRRDWPGSEKFIEWEIDTFPIVEESAPNQVERVIQTIVIEQNVTEKRNLEAHLIQSEKLAAVGQLAAGVAHEINNPLTAIIANAQILRHEIPKTEEDLLESVNLIEMAGTRASQVVRNLLGISRKEKYEFNPIDLNNTLHTAITLVQHELVGRPIQVQLNLAENMPHVLASQDQLQGVWINLILNAIDALDNENGLISVTSAYNGSEFQVTITDNGMGIATDHLPRVFEPFFTTKSAGRGTGLGLSVCMRVIKHHGGTIQVDSQIGKWTRFTVGLSGPK